MRILLPLSYLLFLSLQLDAQVDSFLVKPYLQFATQESIHVLWETTAPATTIVEYGEAQLDAQAPNLSLRKEVDGTRLLHEVQLDGLKVDTKYIYRAKSISENGREIIGPVSTFKTAVKDDGAYFFALIGDSQRNRRMPEAWPKIAQKVWEDRPHFIIHAGDIVDEGPRKTDWTGHFFPGGQIAMSRFPMYTVLGNHERDAQYYYDYMVNPAPEYYYTFRYGNAQFFMIDTNRDVVEGSEQYEWLEWELAKSDAVWKFVVHHHPPYSSEENDHGDTYIGASSYGTHARNLTPLYDAYDVDFCLFGHVHMYERTWPIFENRVNLQDGVVYINSGGAGGGLEDFDPVRSWFTQELQTGHHYCTFAVFDRTLVFKAIDHEGRMFDSFQMSKDEDDRLTAEMVRPPAPRIRVESDVFQEQTTAEITGLGSDPRIHYTLDGSEPTTQSTRYEGPLTIDRSTTLKARAYSTSGKASRLSERVFRKMEPLPASHPASSTPGLAYRYYEGTFTQLPDFTSLEPLRADVTKTLNLRSLEHARDHFAFVFEGYLDIAATAGYRFFLRSDDGSRLYIDDELVIDHDGLHSAVSRYGSLLLEKGKHRIRIEYFDNRQSERLKVGFVDEMMGHAPFSPMQLSH